MFRKNRIKFKVDGKPPQKSQWGTDDAILVIKLREAALETRTKIGLAKCFTTPIKLKLTVYAPNIDDRDYKQTGDNDPKKYIGDLDSLVAGVCDYLYHGPELVNNFVPSPLFDTKPEIGPQVSLIIEDDSQITNIISEKKVSDSLYYVVEIESIS